MEIPIQVAVRIFSGYPDDNESNNSIIQSIPGTIGPQPSAPPPLFDSNSSAAAVAAAAASIHQPPASAGIIQVNASHSFPFAHALPANCSQDQLYHQCVLPMISMFLEGFDASFVTYGQKGMGKTYTMLGPGFNCVFGESEQGIIQRCVRDIFTQLTVQRDRNYVVNIGWVEVCNDEIHDLLDNSGNVPCRSVGDVFHWLQVGMANRSIGSAAAAAVHSIFTLTLEQQWVTPTEGLIQHRLSTASFCDLCATDRMQVLNQLEQPVSVPQNVALQALERIAMELAEAAAVGGYAAGDVNYTETTLTTLLKDSFGGRAQTLLILCISPLESDLPETMPNLQFAFKTQCIRNFVLLNTYSDNNTPMLPPPPNSVNDGGGVCGVDHQIVGDNFGLQFVASQWLKLVSNAEGLFSRLIESKLLNETERERIEEWMFLKQECEECLSSGEIQMNSGGNRHLLGPIEEEEVAEDNTSEADDSVQQNSENDSDTDQLEDLEDKMSMLMEEFRAKTDALVSERYESFVGSHPKAVLDSNDSCYQQRSTAAAAAALDDESPIRRPSSSPRGRRRSLHPGVSLSNTDLARLNLVVANVQQQQHDSTEMSAAARKDPFLDSSADDYVLRSMTKDPMEQLEGKLRKVLADIEAADQQIQELEGTIVTTQELVATLSRRNDSQQKVGYNKKKVKLEADYQKYKKQLAKAESSAHVYERSELDRLRTMVNGKHQMLTEFLSLNNHDENQQKIKMHQKSLKATKKKLDSLQKEVKKNRKHEQELRNEKVKLANKAAVLPLVVAGIGQQTTTTSGGTIHDVSARISHLDHVIEEKSQSLQKKPDERYSFRHEIRQLRRTRDQLVDSRVTLDRKLKKDKRLSHDEQRRLFECDEGIEAIDAAIEYKNELICGGRKSVDTTESLQREKGGRMMMARLNNLSSEEMRVLLYKYFQKAIDFRDSSLQMEKDRDAWESRARHLEHEVQRVRFESERRAAILHQQQEAKLAVYMRHINGTSNYGSGVDESTTSSTTNDRMLMARHHFVDGNSLEVSQSGGGGGSHMVGRHNMLDAAAAGRHYKPMDKYKEKEKNSSSSFFSKMQMFKTQYRGGGGGGGGADAGAISKRKIHDSSMTIPEQNLRQLQITSPMPSTKVTLEKNKLRFQSER